MSTLIFSLDDQLVGRLHNGDRVLLRVGTAAPRYFDRLNMTTWELNEWIPRHNIGD